MTREIDIAPATALSFFLNAAEIFAQVTHVPWLSSCRDNCIGAKTSFNSPPPFNCDVCLTLSRLLFDCYFFGGEMIKTVRFMAACSLVVFSAFHSAQAAAMTLSGTPPTTATVGKYYEFVPVASNANTKSLQFAYVNRPAWSGSYRGSGAVMGKPTAPGVYSNIVIQAWDGVHFATLPPFTITVKAAGSSSTKLQISGTPATSAAVGSITASRRLSLRLPVPR